MTRMAASSVLGQTVRQRRLLMSIADSQPLLDAVNPQRERQMQMLTSTVRSLALEAVTNQRRQLHEQMNAAIGKSPALESMTTLSAGWREQILKSARAAGLYDTFTARNHERYSQLLASIGRSPAMEQAFKNWKLKLPEGLAEQMAAYQAGLLADLTSTIPAEADDDEVDKVWFGAESWSRLVWEMVTILKCAELITTGMTAARAELDAPFPDGVLYLLWIFIAAGELAAHFAKDAFGSENDAS